MLRATIGPKRKSTRRPIRVLTREEGSGPCLHNNNAKIVVFLEMAKSKCEEGVGSAEEDAGVDGAGGGGSYAGSYA